MKVIITGATGFIGSAVLQQCIKNPAITQIVVLSRRDLPASTLDGQRVQVILHENFLEYSDELLEQLQGASACLWVIGGRAGQKHKFKTPEEYIRVSIDYTLSAAKAFAASLAPRLTGSGKFRFVYCSGALAIQDQTKSAWFMEDTRKAKGQVETGLLEIADQNAATFEAYAVRPSAVIPPKPNPLQYVYGLLAPSVATDEVGAAMVDIALKGSKTPILENEEVLQRGKAVIKSLGTSKLREG